MKTAFLCIVLMVFFMDIDPITLEELKWKNRVLLFFQAGDEGGGVEWDMSDSLKKEFTERDLVYFIIGDSVSSNTPYTFTQAYKEKIMRLYALGSKSTCYVLIGKDGGSKLRKEANQPDWEELFATIDAMPMRQREMRDNKD
jgi:hypothetical protein